MTKWLPRVGVAALALIAVVLVVVATRHRTPPPADARNVPYTPKPIAWFVGDSYTAGIGAKVSADSYAYQAAALLGWEAHLDAEPGTGYINPGLANTGDTTFRNRLSAKQGSYLVLAGGYNDYFEIVRGAPVSTFAPAVDTTLDLAHRTVPNAKIIVVGVFWPKPGAVPAEVEAMNATLRSAALARHLTFIDPLGEHWFTAANRKALISADGTHPSPAGHTYIAKRLAGDLQHDGLT